MSASGKSHVIYNVGEKLEQQKVRKKVKTWQGAQGNIEKIRDSDELFLQGEIVI